MESSNLHLCLTLINSMILLLLVSAKNETSPTSDSENHKFVNVGLILDFKSTTGFVANSCISMALSDFYLENPHYTTRLVLHPKNSDDVLNAASAALELVNLDQVDAIIGPQGYNEARFVAEIGGRSQVPIISFSVTSLSYWTSRTPYFIQTTPSDSSQLKGITSLVQKYEWSEIVVLYQEESGSNFIPSLTDALVKAKIQLTYVVVLSSPANVSHIVEELKILQSMQTRVFLVHMTSPQLASSLFSLAKNVSMMGKDTAWIITNALSTSLSSLDASTVESMEGVIGIRPYIPKSKERENFEIRWNNFLSIQQPHYTVKFRSHNTLCLRAYDTAWALATAAEKIQFPTVEEKNHEKLDSSSAAAITNLRISEAGPILLNEIMETKFFGLGGKFRLDRRQLQTQASEIINIVGNGENGDRSVGYWTSESGFSRKIVNGAGKDQGLKQIIWPGDSTQEPRGWDVPGMVSPNIRVLVPKKEGFKEFVNVTEVIGHTKIYNVTGFSIEVFQAALNLLSPSFRLEPKYIPFMNDSGKSKGTYNDLVNELLHGTELHGTKTPNYEVVVGDITIRADREEKVDFSLPYLESGVVMVVRAEPDKLKNMWIFLKPLSWDLWLTVVLAAIFIGVVVRMMERRENPQGQLGMLFLFPLVALAFPERKMVGNNWARFVLVVWLFMAYVLMQSYTANLSSILTVGQLSTSADIPVCAGYQKDTFVNEMLQHLNIPLLRNYSTMEEYHEALSKGCKNGGVDAIYDEIPYINLFLHKYGSKYTKVGTTYSSGGFGFAFPIGSPLSKPMSEAILKIIEDETIRNLTKKYFGEGYTSNYQAEDISRNSPSLTTYSFGGLFIITAFLTLLALICSECSFIISRYNNRSIANISRVHSIEMTYDVAPENDQQNSKEEDEISSEEESDIQEELGQPTNINTDHDSGNDNSNSNSNS